MLDISNFKPLISTESNNRICIKATDNNNNKTSEVICSDVYKLDKTSSIAGSIRVVGTYGTGGYGGNWSDTGNKGYDGAIKLK